MGRTSQTSTPFVQCSFGRPVIENGNQDSEDAICKLVPRCLGVFMFILFIRLSVLLRPFPRDYSITNPYYDG